jgi:hypothetical protein
VFMVSVMRRLFPVVEVPRPVRSSVSVSSEVGFGVELERTS